MARWDDYVVSKGRALAPGVLTAWPGYGPGSNGPEGSPDRQARCDGAAAQRGGCGDTRRARNVAWLPATRPGSAFGRTLPPPEAMGTIRDAFADYDQQGGMAL